jgi:hypothetical protein
MCELCGNHFKRDGQHIRSRQHKLNLFKLFQERRRDGFYETYRKPLGDKVPKGDPQKK